MIVDPLGLMSIERGGTGGNTSSLARKNLEVLKAHILFSNVSGQTGTVTLSDSAANYEYLEIYVIQDGYYFDMARAVAPNGRGIAITTSSYSYGESAVYLNTLYVNVSGTTIGITGNGGRMIGFPNATIHVDGTNTIKISQVVGYK